MRTGALPAEPHRLGPQFDRPSGSIAKPSPGLASIAMAFDLAAQESFEWSGRRSKWHIAADVPLEEHPMAAFDFIAMFLPPVAEVSINIPPAVMAFLSLILVAVAAMLPNVRIRRSELRLMRQFGGRRGQPGLLGWRFLIGW